MFGHLPLPKPIAVALEALPHKQFSDYGMPNDLSYAAICLEPSGRHTLIIGEKFFDCTVQEQTTILIHEFTHLGYGHPLQAARLKLNPEGWNICTDAWINEVHPHPIIQGLNGILYSELRDGMPAKPPTKECPNGIPAREPIPELPPWLLDPLSIYNILKDKAMKEWNGMDSMLINELSQEAQAQAGLETIKARAAIREAAQNDPSMRQLAENLSHSYSGYHGVYTEAKVADWLESIYRQLDRLANMKQGDLVRRRGWRRPGRYPGLPGCARRPSLHVAIALDVSGSTTGWWRDMIAACRGITRNHTVEIICHSDEIVFHGKAIPLDAPVGGGTTFKPVCNLVNRINPDCLIWVTDGESSDHPKLPDCPIYWVWLPGHRSWPLRDGDQETLYQENKA